MSLAARAVVFAVPLLLVLLTAIAVYAYSQIINLNLPVPRPLGLLTIFLPLITGLTNRLTQKLISKAPKNEQLSLTFPVLFIVGFQLIYETVIVTLALTNIIPPSSLNCGLRDSWQAMFSARNKNAIKAIQDRFDCCGLMTKKHQAWPFPDKSHVSGSCADMYGRTKSCLGEWRRAEQTNAGLFLLVAVVCFLVKLSSVLFLTTGSSWSQDRSWIRKFQLRNGDRTDETSGRRIRRLLGDGGETGNFGGNEAYHDDEGIAGIEAGEGDSGPRVEPSTLGTGDGGNPWGRSAVAAGAA